MIRDDEGVWIDDNGQVGALLNSYYKDLFSLKDIVSIKCNLRGGFN